MWLSQFVLLAAFAVLCRGQAIGQEVCSADKNIIDVSTAAANVLLGGLFNLRAVGQDGYGCGSPTTDVMQIFEAAKFAINYVNNGYLQNVKFGMKVYDTCSAPIQALNGLLKLYPQSTSSNPYCVKSTQAVTAGVVGPLTDWESIPVADLAGRIPANLISPRAMSPALSDKSKYPTFLRTIPSSTSLAKALVALLDKLGWEKVFVMYVNNPYGKGVYQDLLKAAYSHGLCVSQSLGVNAGSAANDYTKALIGLGNTAFTAAVFLGESDDAKAMLASADLVPSAASMQWIFINLDMTQDISSMRQARGVQVLNLRSPFITEFRDYFVRLEQNPASVTGNPMFQEWYETFYGCSVTGPSNQCRTRSIADIRAGFVQSPWVWTTIKAVFAYAETIRSICQTSGVCNTLRNMSPTEFNTRLKNLDFTFPSNFGLSQLRGQNIRFDSNGDIADAQYALYNLNNVGGAYSFSEIGSYMSGVLDLSRDPVLYDMSRTNTISKPTAMCAITGCDSCLLPQTSVPFFYTPGNLVIASLIDAHHPGRAALACGTGIPSRLSALVAAEWAVSQFKTFNPTKLRGVSLGSLVADVCPNSLVSDSFLTDLLSGNNRLVDKSGRIVSSSTIKAFVDQTGNLQAQQIIGILSQYNIPEVQTGASTSMLSSEKHPYFSRAVPSDEQYFTAIASLLQRLGWKYIQVATYSSGMYHHQTNIFKRVAARYSVCITSISDFSTGMVNVLSSITSNTGSVVVVIAGTDDLQALIREKDTAGSTIQLVSRTEAWSRDSGLIGVDGLIMLEPQLSSDTNIANFNTWLRNLSRSKITSHPFLLEMFEVTNGCSLSPASRGLHSRACTGTDSFSLYQGTGTTPYVIESINLVANKLHELIAETCQDNYNGLCREFRSATDIGARLNAKLRNSGRTTAGLEIRDGEGLTDFLFYSYRSTGQQYVNIGSFNMKSQQLITVNTDQLGNYQQHQTTCPGVCVQCQYLYMIQGRHFVPGDWIIAGIFSASESGPEALQPYICGGIREVNGPQYTTAMMYAIDQINKGRVPVSVKGVRIGGLMMDHCNNEGRVNLMVSDTYSGRLKDMGVDPTRILSWITDNTDSTVEAAKLLKPLGVAMVSPSATSTSLMEYPTFHRTIQGDITVTSALIKTIKSLGFPYIQVVYSDNDYGRRDLKTLQAVAAAEGICITSAVEMSRDKVVDVVASLIASETQVVIFFTGTLDTRALMQAVTQNSQARNSLLILMAEPYKQLIQDYGHLLSRPVISLQLKSSVLKDYRSYLNAAPTDNPYFARYYMKMLQCNLPGYSLYRSACLTPLVNITSANYMEDNFILPTINAVYASVDALDRTVQEFCGTDYTQPCKKFLQAPNKRQRYNVLLNSANFIDEGQNSFRFLEREGNVAYDILQSVSVGDGGEYRKVGSYAGVSLNMEDGVIQQYADVVSECLQPCLGCIMSGLDFSITPGDIYIAGLFDIHKRSRSPFTCGRINTLHGFLLLEAFHFALNQVNGNEGMFADILHGTKLGGVGLDACGSQIKGGHLVSNINNGLTSLVRDGVLVSPVNIDVYIGSYESASSLYLARILTDLKIPQVSYGSDSSLLNDTRLYPYFYRTVPVDSSTVEAMLKFLDKNNIRYVQILYEDSSNSIMAKRVFEEMAASYRVCVAQAVTYPNIGVPSSETSNAVVSRLIEEPAANTVLTFLRTEFINSVLLAVGRSQRAMNKLRFFGDDVWADNQEAIESAEVYAMDSLTIKMDADEISKFESYINSKTLVNSDENPWFEEYYQQIHNCYTSKTNTMGYPTVCPLSPQSTINSPRYQKDPGVVNVINAVYASAFAIHKTLEETCGKSYTTVCQAYRSNDLRRDLIRDNLADVSFTDPVGNPFEFVDRQTIANYQFYTIKSGIYDQIGSYSRNSSMVSMMNGYQSTWKSDCDREDACSECPAIRDNSVRYVILDSPVPIPENATTVLAFFDIHEQGVDPYRCGKLNMDGFQQFLAFLWSAQLFQNIRDFPNGLRLIAIDTCSNSLRVDQDLYGLLQGTGLCNTVFDEQGLTINIGNIGSVLTVGEANTMAASRILESLGITYVSPNAVSPVLDHTEYLARTIAPIDARMRALVGLLKALGWTYVDVLYEDSSQGARPWDRFSYHANMERICRGSATAIAADAENGDYENALRKLSGTLGSRAVMVMGGEAFIRRVFRTATKLGVADDYLWLLATQWEFEPMQLEALSSAHLKIMTVRPVTDKVGKFDEYVEKLQYVAVDEDRNNQQIPRQWFEEFYQTVHNCFISNAMWPMNADMSECNLKQILGKNKVNQSKHVINTVAAMYAITNGLSEYIRVCDGSCNMGEPLNTDSARDEIRSHVLKTDWKLGNYLNLTNNHELVLRFNAMRWWNMTYDVHLWNIDHKNDVQTTVLLRHGRLEEPSENVVVYMKEKLNMTKSECLQAKASGFCGCTFEKFGPNTERLSMNYVASEHRNYYKYDKHGVQQYDQPIWAIVVAFFTSVGIIVALILFLILLFAYPKRGGTTVLGYMAIVGIIGIYAINFTFFMHASDATCGARRFLMGVMYMITFSALLIKSIDNWRFSHAEYATERYSGISSAWVLLSCAVGLVLVQCIIQIIWLILVHPTASVKDMIYGTVTKHDNWWCDPAQDYDLGLVLSFVFVIFIVLITAIFSAMAYDSDRNNYESRWILFGCIATAGCFLVWMIVTTNAGPPYRDPAVAMGNFVNATILLVVLAIRKCVLMCMARHVSNKEEEDMDVKNRDTPYDQYSNSYNNPTFELADYDNQYVDG